MVKTLTCGRSRGDEAGYVELTLEGPLDMVVTSYRISILVALKNVGLIL